MIRRLKAGFWFILGALKGVIFVIRNRDRTREFHETMQDCPDCDFSPPTSAPCEEHEREFEDLLLGIEP